MRVEMNCPSRLSGEKTPSPGKRATSLTRFCNLASRTAIISLAMGVPSSSRQASVNTSIGRRKPTNASRTSLYDLEARAFDPGLGELFGVPLELLQQLEQRARLELGLELACGEELDVPVELERLLPEPARLAAVAALSSWVGLVLENARWLVGAVPVLTLFLLGYTVAFLGVNSDNVDLIAEEVPSRRALDEFAELLQPPRAQSMAELEELLGASGIGGMGGFSDFFQTLFGGLRGRPAPAGQPRGRTLHPPRRHPRGTPASRAVPPGRAGTASAGTRPRLSRPREPRPWPARDRPPVHGLQSERHEPLRCRRPFWSGGQ